MTGLSREAGKILLQSFNSLVVTERVREILTPDFFSQLVFTQLLYQFWPKREARR